MLAIDKASLPSITREMGCSGERTQERLGRDIDFKDPCLEGDVVSGCQVRVDTDSEKTISKLDTGWRLVVDVLCAGCILARAM